MNDTIKWILLGVGAAAASIAVIKVVQLTKAKIQEAVREKNKEATSAKIDTMLKTGDFNTIDVGLYNRDSRKIDKIYIFASVSSCSLVKASPLMPTAVTLLFFIITYGKKR
ncbi:MAG: hypothetical protein P1P61_01755 [Treponemataceae bacterium]